MPSPNEPLGAPMASPPKKSILEQGLEQAERVARQVPPGKRAVILAGARDREIFFGTAARIGDEWVLGTEIRKELETRGPLEWEFTVRWAK